MSSQNRRSAKERIEADDYVTPPEPIETLLELVELEEPIMDPCCGHGEILKVLEQVGYSQLLGNEINEARARVAALRLPNAIITCADFLDLLRKDLPELPRTVLTNTPYGKLLFPFIFQCLELLPKGGRLFNLMRLNCAGVVNGEPYDAGTGFKGVYLVRPRPSFGKKYVCRKKDGGCGLAIWKPRTVKKWFHPEDGCEFEGLPMRANGTDSVEYAWFEWEKGHQNDGTNYYMKRLPLPEGHPKRR